MRILFLIGIWLTSAYTLLGQNSITGSVKSEKNEPLVGAYVLVNDEFGAATNHNGDFKIDGLAEGEYQFSVSFIGYEKATRTISIPTNQQIVFHLSPDNIMTEEVIVSAIWANQDGPQAHTNVSKEKLRTDNVSGDLPQLLEFTPSVISTSENGTGLGYSSFRIRGTDASRINITVNGIPLNDSESQGVFWVNMPDFASSVEAVQIQRGVGTSTNGSAAFGASVNFRTNDTQKESYGEVQSMIGSFNTKRNTLMAGTGLLDNGFSFDVRYTKLNSDGYIKRGFTDHQAFSFNGSWRNENTLIKALVMMGEERTGITWWGVPQEKLATDRRYNPAGKYTDDNGLTQFYEDQTDNYWQNHYQLMAAHQFNDRLNMNAALHMTTGEGYFEQYKEDEDLADYGINESDPSMSDLTRRKWLDNTFYGYTLAFNYEIYRTKFSLGHSLNYYDGDHFGKINWVKEDLDVPEQYEWYTNKGEKRDLNLFAKANFQITDLLHAYADVQYRNIDYDMTGPDDDLTALDQSHNWDFINPKAGFTYNPDKHSKFYASFGIANREPKRSSLKDAMKKEIIVLPTSERLMDYEAGYFYSSSWFSAGVNFYYMDYKDQLVMTGKVNNVGDPLMTNVKDSYRRGIELQAQVVPCSWFNWKVNATFSQNHIDNFVEYSTDYDDNWAEISYVDTIGQTDISYSPNFIAGSHMQLIPTEGVTINWMSKYVSDQYFDNTSSKDRQLNAYWVNNLRFDFDLNVKGFKKTTLQFLVNNVFDEMYSNNAYGGNWYEQGTENTWAYYYPQAGRNFATKLVVRF